MSRDWPMMNRASKVPAAVGSSGAGVAYLRPARDLSSRWPTHVRPLSLSDRHGGARPDIVNAGDITMAMSGRDRAELRAEAHHLTPLVHVGQHGLSPTVIQSLDDALRKRELVKVQLGRNADVKAKDAAAELASATDSTVIQVIGKTATLYRENPELPRKHGAAPPWKT